MGERSEFSFRMIGDIYYVGIERVSSHLMTSEDGHILIDTCMPDSGPEILQHITELGFNPKDVKYILITHSHIDHLGGTKFLADKTGAKVCVGAEDIEAAEKGRPSMRDLPATEPFKVDRPLSEEDIISLGDKEIRVYHTPGHTPGCCSFGFTVTEDGKEYNGFLFGGPGQNVFKEKNLARGIYGGTLEDYKDTLDRLGTMTVPVWLGAHPGQNRTFPKRDLLSQGAKPNPFIDPQGWKDYIAGLKEKMQKLL